MPFIRPALLALFALSIVAGENAHPVLMVLPVEGETFAFGEVTLVRCLVTNVGRKAVLVTGIRPVVPAGREGVELVGPVYGSISEREDGSGYRYNGMVHQATRFPVHVGLLLPRETVEVAYRFQALDAVGELMVTAQVAEREYDGTAASLAPWKVFVQQVGEGVNALGDAGFVPFTPEAWQRQAAANPTAGSPGPDMPGRAVIVLGQGRADIGWLRFPTGIAEDAFTLGKARAAAAQLTGVEPAATELAWARFLGAWVVFEAPGPWLLEAADQAERGELLAPFDPRLLADLDSAERVSVRIGEKREGLGPDVKESGRKLYERWPVRYGDGMYTRGEFIDITKEDALDFLRAAAKAGKKLRPQTYFFRSRYHRLEDLKDDD